MIKIYELLFEQDTTSTDSSSSSTSSTSGMDPAKLGDVVKKAVGDAVKEPLSSIQAWIKQSEKEKATRPTPSRAEATSSTTSTTASGPSKPAGMGTPNSSNKPTSQQLSPEDINSIADKVSQKISQEKNN